MNEFATGLPPSRIGLSTIFRNVRVAGVIAVLAWSAGVSAAPPPVPDEQNVPLQLLMIREHLDAIDDRLDLMESNLSGQMTTMEFNLMGRMDLLEVNLSNLVGDVQSGVDQNGAKLDLLQTDMTSAHTKLDNIFSDTQYISSKSDEIWGAVSTVAIDVGMTFCLDENIGINIDGGAHGKLGAGWDEVLDIEANFDVNGVLNGGAALTGNICIQVPALRVTSYEPFVYGDYLDTLQPLLASVGIDIGSAAAMRAGVQAAPQVNAITSLLDGLAEAYQQIVPTPQDAMVAINRLKNADADDLLDPTYLLDPVTPQFIRDFIAKVPEVATDFAANPCQTINTYSPFGTVIDTGPSGDPNLKFLCNISAKGLNTTLSVINDIADFLNDVISCILHPVECALSPPEL